MDPAYQVAFKLVVPEGYKAIRGYVQHVNVFLFNPAPGRTLEVFVGESQYHRLMDPGHPFLNKSFPMSGETGEIPTEAQDGWQPTRDTDLTWAEPAPGLAWLFASGADGTVRLLAAADGIWRAFGSGRAPKVRPPSRLDVANRIKGQIEVFTQTSEDDLVWTWWS